MIPISTRPSGRRRRTFPAAKNKLAIARSLFRPASLVILDEPTAALDPLAESEVYEHFHQLTRGRTAIFISHRMSSSTFCDRILLLQDGRSCRL